MDILKKSLAPVTQEAWDEINGQAKIVFNNVLSARRFVDVDGPKGVSFGGVSLGRLDIGQEQNDHDVRYGINQIQPLMEVRKSFALNIWELDDVVRGAEDIDLGAMEEAAGKIAEFEEKAIYLGFDKACIKGLKEASSYEKMNFPKEGKEILKNLADAIGSMKKSFIQGPYHLVVGTEKWQQLHIQTGGYPFKKQVEEIIGGDIIFNPHIEEGFLVSGRGDDFKLTLGQDLSIGYESHNEKEVRLYFTESFTFQILEPAAVIVFE